MEADTLPSVDLPMERFLLSPRHLCLLLLLHLVGGPLVLVGVVTLGKIAVKKSIEHGMVSGIKKATQSAQWKEACDQILCALADDATVQSSSKSDAPKPKDLKSKFPSISCELASLMLSAPMDREPPGVRPESWTPSWTESPPGPPPRAV